jgi:hypothetical protein
MISWARSILMPLEQLNEIRLLSFLCTICAPARGPVVAFDLLITFATFHINEPIQIIARVIAPGFAPSLQTQTEAREDSNR